MRRCGLDLWGSGWGQMAGCFGEGTERRCAN